MVGRAVAMTVESRLCMNIAHATITAVRRVRLLVRNLPARTGLGSVPWGSLIEQWSVASLPTTDHGYGINTVLPVVLRDSSAMWAAAASFSGKVWLTVIFTAPFCTTSNRSAATFSRSARFAV